ncbi:c-type cytochrome [Phenylobacterium soli]|uniref:Cytochrome c family protein n=1 Tax=Phenylobacterium soli TaxID=2170551 RepID=A0A328AKW1_9CAUL|nr:cytochrome c family protein [Phenylobacterium soli]RAK55035.1 cytochrome c family protein [Phenylobacterium soli]
MRNVALTIAAAAVAVGLSGCGKSPGANQADQSQANASAQSTTAGATTGAEPDEHEKKEVVEHLPPPYNTGDIANGETKFLVCKSCHTTTAGGPDMTGPNLSGIIGRKVASKAGYTYSDALKAQTFTWDTAQLDKWLTDPKAMVPGTKMTFPGMKDPKDRIDLIAYLAAETTTHK